MPFYSLKTMPLTKKKTIDCAEFELLSSGILLLTYKREDDITIEDVKLVEEAIIELTQGAMIYCLMDTSGRYLKFTQEAKNYLAKEAKIVQQQKVKCTAVVIDNLPNRIMTNFFLKIFKPKYSLKVFSNSDLAMNWLETELNKRQNK